MTMKVMIMNDDDDDDDEGNGSENRTEHVGRYFSRENKNKSQTLARTKCDPQDVLWFPGKGYSLDC